MAISSTPYHSSLNFSVDGVSVESIGVVYAIFQFLNGKESHTGDVDIKHNVNNYRYQIIGGSFIPAIGNVVVDIALLRQS